MHTTAQALMVGDLSICIFLPSRRPGDAHKHKHAHRTDTHAAYIQSSQLLKFRSCQGVQLVNNVELHYLDPYIPSEAEKKDPKLFGRDFFLIPFFFTHLLNDLFFCSAGRS